MRMHVLPVLACTGGCVAGVEGFAKPESADAGTFGIVTRCRTHKWLQRIWNGPARAYLAAYLDLTSCDP